MFYDENPQDSPVTLHLTISFYVSYHRRSSQYAVTHMRNANYTRSREIAVFEIVLSPHLESIEANSVEQSDPIGAV